MLFSITHDVFVCLITGQIFIDKCAQRYTLTVTFEKIRHELTGGFKSKTGGFPPPRALPLSYVVLRRYEVYQADRYGEVYIASWIWFA